MKSAVSDLENDLWMIIGETFLKLITEIVRWLMIDDISAYNDAVVW